MDCVAALTQPYLDDVRMGDVPATVKAVDGREGYIGFVEELPGANTQGETLEEARANLQEAVRLVLESNRQLAEEALAGRAVVREPLRISAA